MTDQLRILIIGFLLVLGACDPGEPGDETEPASDLELRTLDGLDPDCVDVNAPIIARIDPDLTTCEFNGFDDFSDNWTATVLFEDGSPMLQAATELEPLVNAALPKGRRRRAA